ncbi:hypothetical protein COO60DRAFT_1524215, partial [Scenedesmus sp. NREL 46B-D3]
MILFLLLACSAFVPWRECQCHAATAHILEIPRLCSVIWEHFGLCEPNFTSPKKQMHALDIQPSISASPRLLHRTLLHFMFVCVCCDTDCGKPAG